MTEIILTDEEKDKLRAEAAKEVEAENKKRAKDEYKAAAKAVLNKKKLLSDAPSEEGLEPVYVNLTSVSDCVRLDGKAYYHGRTYHVTPEVKAVLLDAMGQGQKHEESLMDKGEKENAYRRRTSLSVK